MKKQSLVLLLFFSVTFYSSSGQLMFQKTYDANFYTGLAMPLQENGYILMGIINFQSIYDLGLVKVNMAGDTTWSRKIGENTVNNNTMRYGRETNDGGFIFTGTRDLTSTSLLKTDGNGNTLWYRNYWSDTNGWWVEQTSDGGYIIAGKVKIVVAVPYDNVHLIKTDAAGDTLWTRTFGNSSASQVGLCVKQTVDGGYIVAGNTGMGSGMSDYYLIKTNSAGNLVWSKTYGGTGIDGAFSVLQTSDGGYMVGGQSSSFSAGGYTDLYLIRTDSAGNLQWSKTYGGAFTDAFSGMAPTTDGGFIIAGYSTSFSANTHTDTYLIRIDATGNVLWSKKYGGMYEDRAYSVFQTNDGGFMVGGTSEISAIKKAHIIKTDSQGSSSCNEASVTTITSIPPTLVTNPPTQMVYQIIYPNTLPTMMTSGVLVNTLCNNVGIEQTSGFNAFEIFPNPSNSHFEISFSNTIIKGSIKVFDSIGSVIFEENIFDETKKEINLKNLSGGIYFVRVFDGEKSYCKKLIVERD